MDTPEIGCPSGSWMRPAMTALPISRTCSIGSRTTSTSRVIVIRRSGWLIRSSYEPTFRWAKLTRPA